MLILAAQKFEVFPIVLAGGVFSTFFLKSVLNN